MKRILTVTILLLSAVYYVSFGQTGITFSAHDFSTESWAATSENTMCGVCHTTHNAKSITGAPLWNHETNENSYTVYSSATLNAVITTPIGSSKLCLGCHDGIVALENFGDAGGGTNFILPTSDSYIGTDLSDDHPISFDYTSTLAGDDDGLYDPFTSSSGLGSTITNDMLFDDKMECASCHDVHNKYGVPHLLKMANTDSELCLTCHDK